MRRAQKLYRQGHRLHERHRLFARQKDPVPGEAWIYILRELLIDVARDGGSREKDSACPNGRIHKSGRWGRSAMTKFRSHAVKALKQTVTTDHAAANAMLMVNKQGHDCPDLRQ